MLEGDPAAAIEHYERGLADEPDHALASGNLGIVLVGQGRYDEARPRLERAQSIDRAAGRTRPAVRRALGDVLVEQNQLAAALPVYTR